MSDFTKPVLALDSALGGCIVAVLHNGNAYSRALETDREQAVKLMPMVQDVMNEAGVEFAHLGLIVTTTGPGSFTGLRISLSTARTLGLALSLPVQGMTTMNIMARTAVPENRDTLVILETKRTDFYVQGFAADKTPLFDPACLEAPALQEKIAERDWIFCGDNLSRANVDGRNHKLLDPVILAKAGLAAFLNNGRKAERPEPLYLRGADVSMSKKIGREINMSVV